MSMLSRSAGALSFILLAAGLAMTAQGQMVSSSDVKAQYDTTADLPDTIPASASLEALAGKYEPEVKLDEFDKSRLTLLEIGHYRWGHANKHLNTKCNNGVGEIFELKLAKWERPAKPVRYGMYVQYFGFEWVFAGDTPLQLLADTTLIEFKAEGPAHQTVGYGGSVTEEVLYEAPAADLRRLAAARTIKSRISGSGGSCTSVWRSGTVAGLRQFVAHEVPAS